MAFANVDTEAALLKERIAELEHTLDQAQEALDVSASMARRELARRAIEKVLLRRRTLRRSTVA